MSTVTENDLKRLEDLIVAFREENRQRLTGLEAGITGIQKEISDLRASISKVEGSLQNQQPFVQKIPDLAEKVGELKNWRQLVIIALTACYSLLLPPHTPHPKTRGHGETGTRGQYR